MGFPHSPSLNPQAQGASPSFAQTRIQVSPTTIRHYLCDFGEVNYSFWTSIFLTVDYRLKKQNYLYCVGMTLCTFTIYLIKLVYIYKYVEIIYIYDVWHLVRI